MRVTCWCAVFLLTPALCLARRTSHWFLAPSSAAAAAAADPHPPKPPLPTVSPGNNRCSGPTGNSHHSHIKVLLSNSANGAWSVKQSARWGGKESPTEITTAQFTQCEHPPPAAAAAAPCGPHLSTPPLPSTGLE
ncbi:unnamed protein product [Pleuronectes platessa]|uniref:Uncharacterized protein n=1 Tax=Pleuronectes platessa TaxID=8262 RepID=A0A9N7TIT9_PLEPL|nr:unnamed protein product [Pleuronectes platessa]